MERDGWRGTLRLIGINLLLLPRQLFRKPKPKDPFDEEHGVETSRHVKLSELEIESPNFAFGIEYSPVMPSRFRAAMECLAIDHRRFTFVDLGSGKGRPLLMAATLWPFRQVIGVEFSEELHRAASRNIAEFKGVLRCPEVQSVREDATEFRFPNEPLVVFMYNPFVGRTMIQVLRNLEESARSFPREIYVVYVHPKMAQEFAASPLFEPLVTDVLHCVFRSRTATASER
jgi:hypothetical protein